MSLPRSVEINVGPQAGIVRHQLPQRDVLLAVLRTLRNMLGQRIVQPHLAEFEHAFTRSLSEPGVTIIDVLVDYTRNTELFAELHDDVLE